MNLDDFEQRLQRQPLRPVPDEWRAEILGAANAAVGERQPRAVGSSLNPTSWLRELIWPNPQAWAGLAAVWLVIFALKLSTGDDGRVVGKKSSMSPEVIAELWQQKLLFTELVGEVEVREAKPPKRLPSRPRSERPGETRSA